MHGLDGVFRFQRREELACGLGLLDHEILQSARDGDDMLGQDLRRRRVSQSAGDEIEGACLSSGHILQYKRMFSRRSISVSKINGKPIKAFGSSPRMLLISAMPKPSDLALPAQW